MIAIEYLAFITVLRQERRANCGAITTYAVKHRRRTSHRPLSAQRRYNVIVGFTVWRPCRDFVRRVFVGGGKVRAGVSISGGKKSGM
jgi:hypothetical protein